MSTSSARKRVVGKVEGGVDRASMERGAESWHEESEGVWGESDPVVNICPMYTAPCCLRTTVGLIQTLLFESYTVFFLLC